MGLLTLISITCDTNGGVNISFPVFLFWACILLVVVLVILYFWLTGNFQPIFKVEEIEIPFGSAKVKFKRTVEVATISHRAWVELITRKAALPFDEENDLVLEVYNSWYELFRIIRELILSIPPDDIRNDENAKKLLEKLIDVLNVVMRPHLTKWQARFRSWWDSAELKNSKLSPQERQRKFPKYKELVKDLKKINRELQKIAKGLKQLADGKNESSD